MGTCVQNPSCFALFDPIAPECASCGIQTNCMREQERRLGDCDSKQPQQSVETTPTSNQSLKPKRKEKIQTKIPSQTGDEQYIPEHTRKPLEIPPVGSTIQTTYRGKTYEAIIVDDPSNKRCDGRSILFNGTVYRTLTAAAHAIAPGINSGSVWQEI